jgi:hypothetical protein
MRSSRCAVRAIGRGSEFFWINSRGPACLIGAGSRLPFTFAQSDRYLAAALRVELA